MFLLQLFLFLLVRSSEVPELSDSVMSMKRLESMPNFDTDAPNNSIAVFANVQIPAPVNSPAAAEFVIAVALEIISILPTLL